MNRDTIVLTMGGALDGEPGAVPPEKTPDGYCTGNKPRRQNLSLFNALLFFSFFFLLLIVSRKTDTKFFIAPSAWLFNSACPVCVPFPAPLTYMT